jgi:hypothetical protein
VPDLPTASVGSDADAEAFRLAATEEATEKTDAAGEPKPAERVAVDD